MIHQTAHPILSSAARRKGKAEKRTSRPATKAVRVKIGVNLVAALRRIGLAIFLSAFGTAVWAQSMPGTPSFQGTSLAAKKQYGLGNGSLVVAPIPFQDPNLGTGLALGGAYLFQRDAKARSSYFGFGGFRTSNGSEGVGLGTSLYLGDSRWQADLTILDASLNYDLYVLGVPVPIRQSAIGAITQLTYGATDNLSFKFGLAYAESTVGLRLPSGSAAKNAIALDADLSIAKINLATVWDTRDDEFYPTRGLLASANLSYGEMTNVSGRGYVKAVAKVAGYRPVFDTGVLAGQIVACKADKDAPFFDSCAIGPSDSFRGYASTQFLDNALVSVQAEYRGRFNDRFGFVVFGGAGSVAGTLGNALSGSFQTAAGLGLRIRLDKDLGLDYDIDYSINEASEKYLYISVGQRF
jgi:hypothetical protein